MTFLVIGNNFGLPLKNKIGSRKCSFVAGLGISISLFISSFCYNFTIFFLFYSISAGFFIGLNYIPALNIP